MRERHELEIEAPVQHGGLTAHLPHLLMVAGGVIGAICATFMVSFLLAHPASAAVIGAPAVPAAAGDTPSATVLASPATPDVASVADAVVPQLQTLVTAVGSPVLDSAGLTPDPVVTELGTVSAPLSMAVPPLVAAAINPIVQSLDPVLESVVQTLTQVLTVVSGEVSRVVADQATVGIQPLPAAIAAPRARLTNDAPPRSAVVANHSGSPANRSPYAPPFQVLPLVTSGSPTGDAVPSAGSTAIAVNPGSGLLLPDPAVSRVGPEQSRTPELLFDLRSSPPG